MKKISLLLIGIVLFPLNVSAAFSDVPESHPNFAAINFVQEKGIVQGYADGIFRPDQMITRAEFTKIIVSTFHGEMDGSEAKDCPTLSDMKSGEWYFPFVCSGLKWSIISGYPDKTFRPHASVNFVEAAKIISNAAGLRAISDDSTIWYKHFVLELEHVRAIPLTIDSFDQKITRGEMVEMVYRLLSASNSKEYFADKHFLQSETYDSLSGKASLDELQSVLDYDPQLLTRAKKGMVLLYFAYDDPKTRINKALTELENAALKHPASGEMVTFLVVNMHSEVAKSLMAQYSVQYPGAMVQVDVKGRVLAIANGDYELDYLMNYFKKWGFLHTK